MTRDIHQTTVNGAVVTGLVEDCIDGVNHWLMESDQTPHPWLVPAASFEEAVQVFVDELLTPVQNGTYTPED